jgi:copper chaperone CopZ
MSVKHGCGHEPVARLQPSSEAGARATDEVRLLLEGLGCRNCAARVYNALVSLAGVGSAEVSLDPPRAVVHYDPAQVSAYQMVSAVSEAGIASHHRYRAALLS